MPPLWVAAPSSKVRAGRGSERGSGCWWRVIALSSNYPAASRGEKTLSFAGEHEVTSNERNVGRGTSSRGAFDVKLV